MYECGDIKSDQECSCHLVNAHGVVVYEAFDKAASLKYCHLNRFTDKTVGSYYREVCAEDAGGH